MMLKTKLASVEMAAGSFPAPGLFPAAVIFCAAAVLFCAAARAEVKLPEGTVTVQVASAMAPPEWALKQRLLLEENTRAVLTFHERYHDKRGWLKCKARWSIVDGIDDVMENCGNWPLLYSLGADRAVLDAFKKAFDGHIEQFSRKGIEYAPKWGCVYNEYVTAFDWQHHSEQYSAFNQLTVADPGDRKFAERIKRFAGFYLNDGLPAGAEPNFDFTHKIIRSVMTGSRGALMEMEPIYWGNKWEEIGSWERMGRWTNIKGDWTENAYATTQAANAFIMSGDEKYRKWVLEYMDAWAARAAGNGDIIPANVGLSGKVGEHWDGNWWGAWDGGWKLSNGMLAGAENALLLSGDAKYVDMLRRQVKALLAKAVEDKGKMYPPSQYDANGWSGKAQFGRQLVRMYLTDFREDDLKLIEDEMLLLFQVDVDTRLGIPHLGLVVGLAGTAASIAMMAANHMVLRDDTHEEQEHKLFSLRETLLHNAGDTAFAATWVFAAYAAYELAVMAFGGGDHALGNAKMEELMRTAGVTAVLVGALIGLIPGCGPQIIFVALFAKGLLPFSALLANAISQDGDALFPLIAMNRRSALWATVITTIPALIVGLLIFYLGLDEPIARLLRLKP